MRISLVITFLVVVAGLVPAGPMPLTTKEIGLMLRTGYSSDAILHELSVRKFADTVDSEAEKQLVRSGASSALVDALRAGDFHASEVEIAESKEKLEAQIESQEAAGAAQKTSQPKGLMPSNSATVVQPGDAIYRFLKDDLVYRHQGEVTHFDDESFEHKKLYLFFFSAMSSAPSRKLTSQLVDYYNRVTPEHPEFELIFFSADRSQFGMETSMAQSNMPWPAVRYDKLAGKSEALPKDLVHEVPFLILLDGSGKIISSGGTSDPKNNVDKVLADLDQILARGDDRATRSRH
jgi:hypothetical protein